MPASGARRASSPVRLPIHAHSTPRARSAAATASPGEVCPPVPPPAIRIILICRRSAFAGLRRATVERSSREACSGARRSPPKALRRQIRMILIAGGGTGGHTSPGLAVAAALRARGVECAWIGSRTGLEARRAPEAGIPYHAIRTGKLRRALAWQNVPDVFVNAPAGVLQAWRLLRRLRPRVVFTTGGFVALPVALAASLARVPVVVHEQTAVPGLANRVAARLARRVAVTFAESARFFGATPTVVTGNPLRPELRHGRRAAALKPLGFDPTLPLLYVTGGAQGSHAINRAVGEVLPDLLAHTQCLHQSGDNKATGDRTWL